MKVRVHFRQRTGGTLSKTIELAAVPRIGDDIEYEDGWASTQVKAVLITKDEIILDFYGPGFDVEERAKLNTLGWEML